MYVIIVGPCMLSSNYGERNVLLRLIEADAARRGLSYAHDESVKQCRNSTNTSVVYGGLKQIMKNSTLICGIS